MPRGIVCHGAVQDARPQQRMLANPIKEFRSRISQLFAGGIANEVIKLVQLLKGLGREYLANRFCILTRHVEARRHRTVIFRVKG